MTARIFINAAIVSKIRGAEVRPGDLVLCTLRKVGK